MQDKIIIKGAREHNLKNISLELPRNNLLLSQDSQDQENQHSHLTPSTQKDKEDMLKASAHTQDNFSHS